MPMTFFKFYAEMALKIDFRLMKMFLISNFRKEFMVIFLKVRKEGLGIFS